MFVAVETCDFYLWPRPWFRDEFQLHGVNMTVTSEKLFALTVFFQVYEHTGGASRQLFG
jgi:hypothetical protein